VLLLGPRLLARADELVMAAAHYCLISKTSSTVLKAFLERLGTTFYAWLKVMVSFGPI
jgi:hypothetical protein